MKYFLGFLASFLTVCAPVSAQYVCTPWGWRLPTTEREERALILGRSLPDYRHPQAPRDLIHPRFQSVLATLGLSRLWPDAPRYGSLCEGYSTDMLLERARDLGPDHPYLAALAENQVRLQRQCRSRSIGENALIENWRAVANIDSKIETIARQDFAYLSAASEFHRRRFDEARASFAAIAANPATPHRDAARLMEIRALRALKDHRSAFSLVRTYAREADGDFKIWMDEQEDLIALTSNIPEFRVTQLEKVYQRAYAIPRPGEPAEFRRAQAAYDLETYFVYEHDRLRRFKASPHDWWLRDEPPTAATTAFAAVQALSNKYDDIGWIAARHASRAYTRDNTWFAGADLDIAAPDYQRVTEHAYRKWKTGGLDHWAAIVAARIEPGSPHAGEVIEFTEELQQRAQSCSLSPSEYTLYSALLRHAVRLAGSEGDYDTALALLKNYAQNQFYPKPIVRSGGRDEKSVGRAFINLLMIRGEYEVMSRYQSESRARPSGEPLARRNAGGSRRLWEGKRRGIREHAWR